MDTCLLDCEEEIPNRGHFMETLETLEIFTYLHASWMAGPSEPVFTRGCDID